MPNGYKFITEDIALYNQPELNTIGTYELTETIAPSGYAIAEDIYFSIDEEGYVYTGSLEDKLFN